MQEGVEVLGAYTHAPTCANLHLINRLLCILTKMLRHRQCHIYKPSQV